MSEIKPIRASKANLKINTNGETGLLILSDDAGNSTAIEMTIDGFLWFVEQLPQMILDADGERALGERRSALVSDPEAPQGTIPTHAVVKFLLVDYEQGGRVLEFLTHENAPMRFAMTPELATDLSVALAPGSDQPPPDTQGKSSPTTLSNDHGSKWLNPAARHQDAQWFAVIGAIMVKWGAIEKMVATSIHQIEAEVAIASGTTPVETDLRRLRDFKERKGHLRKLFEQHALRDELAMLDTIYQKLIVPGRIRHALGHDLLALQPMTEELAIIKHGNPARGTTTQTTWKTYEDLVATLREIVGIPDVLARLTIGITMRFRSTGKGSS